MNKSILLVGSFSVGALEHQFTERLKNLGWHVYNFDIQTPIRQSKNKNYLSRILYRITPSIYFVNINNQLISFCKQNKPEVILIFKGMEIFPDTLEEIRKYTKLLCNYNPDHPFDFYSRGAGNSNVKESIKYYDLYGSYSKSITNKLNTLFNIPTFILPFGYDDTIKPTMLKTSQYFSFIGAYDCQRLDYLNKLKNTQLKVYGSQLWTKRISISKTDSIIVNATPIYNQDYANLCNESLGVINLLRPQNIIEQSHNMRTFEVPGYGGLLISEKTEEQLNYFEEDKEAIYFETIDELKDKMSFYKKNISLVKNCKMQAYQRSQKSGYSYTDRCRELSQIICSYLD